MISLRLVFLTGDPDAPASVVERDEAGVRRRVWSPAAPADPAPVHTVLVVPGAQARACWLDLPDGSPAQARGAAAFALEGDLAAAGAKVHVAVGDRDADGRRLVVVTEAEALAAWLAAARALGLAPDRATPDYLLLPAPDDAARVTTAAIGDRLAARGQGLALCAEADLVETLIAGRPRDVVAAEALDRVLVEGADRAPIDLLQGAFASDAGRSRRGGLRRLAGLAAVLLLSPLVIAAAQAWRLDRAADRLEAANRARAVAIAPAAARFEDPAAYVIGRLRAQGGQARFTTLAARFYQALEATGSVKLDTLVYVRGDALRSTVAYANYSDIDQLRRAADQAGLVVTEESTLTEGGRLTSDLVVRSRP